MYDDADALRRAQPWLTPRGTTGKASVGTKASKLIASGLDGARVPRLIEPFVKNYSAAGHVTRVDLLVSDISKTSTSVTANSNLRATIDKSI